MSRKSSVLVLSLAATGIIGCGSESSRAADAAAVDAAAVDAAADVSPAPDAAISADATVDRMTAEVPRPQDGSTDLADDARPSPQPDGPLTCLPMNLNRQWGTAYDDHALGIAVDGEGSVYLAGYEGGLAGHAVEPIGGPIGFVEKWSHAGRSFRYERSSDGADVVDAIDVRPRGQVVFAGRHAAAEGGYSGAYDLVVGELNEAGKLAGAHVSGGPRPEHPKRIVAVAFTSVVAGFTDAFLPASYPGALEEPFVHLSRPSNPSEFFGSFSTDHADVFRALAVDNIRGGIYAGGWSQRGPLMGAFIARFLPSGRLDWTHVVSPAALDAIAALRLLDDGDLLIVGSTSRKLGEQQHGQLDLFVMRFDPTKREVVWTSQAGGASGELAVDVAIDGSGAIHVLADVPERTGTRNRDLVIYSFSSDGALLRSVERTSSGDERPSGIAVGPCGELLVVGATNGAIIRDAAPAKGYDAFVVTLPALD